LSRDAVHRLIKALVPFTLAFAAGIVLHLLLVPGVTKVSIEERLDFSEVSVPITHVTVPSADFPEAAKHTSGFFGGSVRLRALFDADGKVKQVRPYPMLPYGMAESAAGHGEFRDYTSAMVSGRFVSELPFGLTELAVDQIRRTEFSPAMSQGRLNPEWVTIEVEFSFNEGRYAAGCSEINVTIMDSRGVVWNGNTWVHRDRGCSLI
jgi:hypothetical protein